MPTTKRAFLILAGLAWAAKVAADAGAPGSLLSFCLVAAGVCAAAGVFLRRAGERWLDPWRCVLVLLALMHLPMVYPRLGGDGYQCYVLLRSPLFDRDLELANDYAGLSASPVVSAQGEVTSRFPIGLALVWLPPFLLAHVGATLASWLGARVAADGFSPLYQSAVTSATYVYGIVALLLLEGELRKRYGAAVAGLAVLGLWLATPLHFYLAANPFMTHGASAATAILFVLAWLRARETRERWPWALTGMAGGLMSLVRPQDAVLLALPLADLLLSAQPDRTRRALSYAAGPLGLGLVQLAVWLRFYGLAFAQVISGQSYVGHTEPQMLDLLFSARHGLFTWTPLYLGAVAGWLIWVRREARLAILYAVGFFLSVFVNSSMQDWWGSESFGQRRMLGLTPLFAWGLAEALRFLFRRPAWLAGGVLAALIGWNLQLSYIYNSNLVARKTEAVSLDRLAAAQVEVLYQKLLGWEGRLPQRLWFLLYDNLKGVWLDEGPRSLEGLVDLGSEPADFPQLLGGGWYGAAETEGETTLRRSKGRLSTLRIPIRTLGSFEAAIRVRPEVGDVPVQLRLEVNGAGVGEADLTPGWNLCRFKVPEAALKPGLNTFTLAYSTTPKRSIPGYHGKNAAVSVDWLRLERRDVRQGPI